MGCDSGATIAQLLAASPITAGLFDQVIAMSPLNTNMAGLSQLDAREVSHLHLMRYLPVFGFMYNSLESYGAIDELMGWDSQLNKCISLSDKVLLCLILVTYRRCDQF